MSGKKVPRIVPWEMMREHARHPGLLAAVEDGFIRYSTGRSVVPPVGELVFEEPPGDVHIKYGYLKGGDRYVIKVATSFFENPRLGLSSSDGLMLVFDQKTGALEAVLLDEGNLTNIRTAIAGAIAARLFAPKRVETIGIVGTGIQARLQLEYVSPHVGTKRALVWGRSAASLEDFSREMGAKGFDVTTTTDADAIVDTCELIVTATPSYQPILRKPLRPGTHVTAVGSDTPQKQELDAELLRRADLLIVDSRSQCAERGELAHAGKAFDVDLAKVPELGEVLAGHHPGRTSDAQVTIADLTGVAVQDIAIASFVWSHIAQSV